jgi:hypothetical protein
VVFISEFFAMLDDEVNYGHFNFRFVAAFLYFAIKFFCRLGFEVAFQGHIWLLLCIILPLLEKSFENVPALLHFVFLLLLLFLNFLLGHLLGLLDSELELDSLAVRNVPDVPSLFPHLGFDGLVNSVVPGLITFGLQLNIFHQFVLVRNYKINNIALFGFATKQIQSLLKLLQRWHSTDFFRLVQDIA